MARGTIYSLDTGYGLAEVAAIALERRIQDIPCEVRQWPPDELLSRRLRPLSGFGFQPATFLPDEGEVTLFSVESYVELPRSHRVWLEEQENIPHLLRVRRISAELLFFEHQYEGGERRTFLSVGASSQATVNHLRDGIILPVWGGILPALDLHIDEDLMYWLWSKFLLGQGVVADHCFIAQIRSFSSRPMGTMRLNARGQGTGDLTEGLTTLAKNEPLWRIGLDLDHFDESISVTLHRDGQVEVLESTYVGDYAGNREGPEFRAMLLHYVYVQLIPDLKRIYTEECAENLWGVEQRNHFVAWCRRAVRDRMLG